MTLPHVLFPDNSPPAFRDGSLEDGILWMLAVMDPGDPGKKFVVSVYSHFLNYGEISEKQFAALKRTLMRVSGRFHEGTLRCQGYTAAPVDARLTVGEIVQFPQMARHGGVIDHE